MGKHRKWMAYAFAWLLAGSAGAALPVQRVWQMVQQDGKKEKPQGPRKPKTAKGKAVQPADSLKAGKDSVAAKKPAAPKKKNEYEELVKKGGTVMKGLFTVRHIDNKWYFEIPDSMLHRHLLCVTRYTSVPQGLGKYAGEQVNESTIYFEKRDDKTMFLRAYVLSQFADSTNRIAKTLVKSTVDPVMGSFRIIGTHPDKAMSMIEVTSLFLNDNKLMATASTGPGQMPGPTRLSGLMGNRSYIDTLKVFPINIEVATTRTYGANGNSPAGQLGVATLGMNTSILLLPKEPMRPRLWDSRVGYFVNSFTRFSDTQRKTQRESMIARYRLVPKDVKAYMAGKLVEPVKPIIYYIDPATPKQWVPYLIQGINDWNEAFEAAGFKNAIQGREWPNDPNMSMEDARFCVLRYLPTEMENAYGPHVSDPRSGEIMESHVCWYHNITNLLTKWYMTQCGPLDKRAQTMQFDEKLMGELVRFVSSHEVGHSLGLRHNMGASHATPVEKLRDKQWVEKYGHTASIMDYARFNYVAQPEDKVGPKGLFPRINDYDKWAIKWGYTYRPEFKDEYAEQEAMRKETTQFLATHPRCWFSGEGRDEDPRSQTEDLGDDSMKASDYGVMNLQRVVANLLKWTKQSDDRYDDLRTMYVSVLDQMNRYLGHVLKNIGGHYFNNMPGSIPVEVAPGSKGLSVVDWVGRNVFEAPLWLYPTDITEKTGFNVAIEIPRMQRKALGALLKPTVLARIYNDSFSSPNALQLDAYLDALQQQVWKSFADNTPMQAQLRRNLQADYLQTLTDVLNPAPANTPSSSSKTLQGALVKASTIYSAQGSDVTLYVLQHLDKIAQYVQAQEAASTGLAKAHYQEMLVMIKLIRERRETVK